MNKEDRKDLVERLRGIYRIPITDGLGPAGGEEPDNPNEFVRTFPSPPIQHEAAAEITRLRRELAEARKALEPFALMSSEGVIKAETGYVSIKTCAEYFHAARAAFQAGEEGR